MEVCWFSNGNQCNSNCSHEVEDCCTKGKTDECFPIPVPNDDNFYGPRNVTCLEFRRSVIFCEEKGGSKEQFNEVSHFIDASTVYGSEEQVAHELRTFVDGKLKVSFLHNRLFLITDDFF